MLQWINGASQEMIGFRSKNKNTKQLGLSLLEALVATAIVGIGFIAIFQMVKYSVESISVSSDRTKANYLVSMIAEDVVGNRNTKISGYKFADHLRRSSHIWEIDRCKRAPKKKSLSKTLYYDEKDNAPQNKIRKWNELFTSDSHVRCLGKDTTTSVTDTTTGMVSTITTNTTKDIKALKIITICHSAVICDFEDSNIFDKMYFGRMLVNMNNGKKRKHLYFQAHYELGN